MNKKRELDEKLLVLLREFINMGPEVNNRKAEVCKILEEEVKIAKIMESMSQGNNQSAVDQHVSTAQRTLDEAKVKESRILLEYARKLAEGQSQQGRANNMALQAKEDNDKDDRYR